MGTALVVATIVYYISGMKNGSNRSRHIQGTSWLSGSSISVNHWTTQSIINNVLAEISYNRVTTYTEKVIGNASVDSEGVDRRWIKSSRFGRIGRCWLNKKMLKKSLRNWTINQTRLDWMSVRKRPSISHWTRNNDNVSGM